MAGRRGALFAAVALLAVAVGAAAVSLTASSDRVLRGLTPGTSDLLLPADRAEPAPELAGITGWLNSDPLSLAGLRSQRRVVMVDFWTYTCINCRRTFPFLQRLHSTYAGRGLTVIGVHSPEFDFEKISDNVARAVDELGVTWPVAEDPNMRTWRAFDNQYWPAKFLIDAEGRLRGFHVGEGGEDEVERAVRALLVEAGADPGRTLVGEVVTAEQPGSVEDPITPELYVGAQRGDRYYARPGPVPAGRTESRTARRAGRDLIRLSGRWTGAAEYALTAAAGARLDLAYRARDVYLLAAPARGAAIVELEVRLGGEPVPAARRGRDLLATADGRTVLRIDDDDLRHVLTGPAVEGGELTLVADGAGARLFAFTFGA